jgi:uncharacterized protein with HEPN domain
MPPDDEIRVRHLVEAASKAVSYAAGRRRDDDEMLRLALTKLVEIVGEVAKHISHDLRESHPGGAVVSGGTNAGPARSPLLRHHLDVLWNTVTDDLPRLLATLSDDLIRDGF